MAAMTDSHRLLLQTFMSKGILNSQEVKTAFKQACHQMNVDPENCKLVEFVHTINDNIRGLQLQIKKAVSEQTNAHFYCLVSVADTQITRLASEFSENEYEFFKKLIESIVESEKGEISSTEALYLVGHLEKKMSQKEAQDLLHRLEKAYWILQTQGKVHLSTRTLAEMDVYVHQQFPDHAIDCNVCKRLCIQGTMCENCDTKLHAHCGARFFANTAEPKCPACGAPWRQDAVPLQRSRATNDVQAGTSAESTQRDRESGRKRKHRH